MDTQEARPEHYTGSPGAEQIKKDAVNAAKEPSSFTPRPAQTSAHRKSSYDRGVQIAAAKLRVATDRRIGETTPDWITELAAEMPRSNAS